MIAVVPPDDILRIGCAQLPVSRAGWMIGASLAHHIWRIDVRTESRSTAMGCGHSRRLHVLLRQEGSLSDTGKLRYLTEKCDRLRDPDQLRRLHVAPPAPNDVKFAEALIAAG